MKKNWKKFLCIAMALCLIFALAACGGGNKDADTDADATDTGDTTEASSDFDGAPTFDLKIAHPQPDGSSTDLGYRKFAELMEEYTEGTVKATIYPAGSLVSSAEAVEGLRNGTIDIAQISSGDAATVIPALNLIEVPGSYSQANTDYVEGLAPAMREAMDPYGIHFLYPQPGSPSWLFSNLKQITSPDDTKGLKVRASGKYGGLAIERWGGSPVTITLADLTTAMERNTVDVILTPGLGAYSNGWYELEHFITVSDISTLMAMMTISKSLWDQMTPAQQEAVDRAALDGAMHMYEETLKEMEEGMGVMEAYGNELYTLTDAENALFIDALQPLRDEVVAEVGAEAEKLEAELAKFR
ncbi:MAG: TRAP transporter substrate-binding protein [Clostridiales Family XIII bacterium]|jgi:TRAP-type C4-dicarboxylate transport system substrate-binding protein|nr:TRAP transporter substrate-binding protein [Clostridiales Family XIII bacterium]